MTKRHRPRRGSLAYSPRKRAKSEIPRIRSWPQQDEPQVQGFAGYKAGMTHVIIVDETPTSPTAGLEISVPVTVVETPPMKIAALRAYQKTSYGKRVVLETWASNISGNLAKLRPLPKKGALDAGSIDGADEIRVLVHTSPAAVSGIPKKKPELMEMPVGGDDVNAAYSFAQGTLGKEIEAANVFKEGVLIDVTAVTKGKGVQGPVKRWGVTIQ
ncbi:MAG TPA: 50S ribosomal protein L3, partial [archaeon]